MEDVQPPNNRLDQQITDKLASSAEGVSEWTETIHYSDRWDRKLVLTYFTGKRKFFRLQMEHKDYSVYPCKLSTATNQVVHHVMPNL